MQSFKQFINEEERVNNSQRTQVATTSGTYRKTGKFLKDKLHPQSRVLSVGAGLDQTTEGLHQGLGENHDHTVHDFEPYPENRKNPPTFTHEKDIPKDHYHASVSHNVLNVVEPHEREGVMHNIFHATKSGGHAVIGTRSWKGDIEKNKNFYPGDEPKSMWVRKKKKGGGEETSYQKGFDDNELKDYAEDYAKRHGHTVTVKKLPGMAKSTIHIHIHKKAGE